MLFNTIKILSLVITSVLIISCGSSSSDSGTGLGKVNSLSDITGVYEDFDDIGSGITDEYYMVIESSGVVTFYDYYGDNYDNGSDCYDYWYDFDISHVSENHFIDQDGDSFDAKFNSNGDCSEFCVSIAG